MLTKTGKPCQSSKRRGRKKTVFPCGLTKNHGLSVAFIVEMFNDSLDVRGRHPFKAFSNARTETVIVVTSRDLIQVLFRQWFGFFLSRFVLFHT